MAARTRRARGGDRSCAAGLADRGAAALLCGVDRRGSTARTRGERGLHVRRSAPGGALWVRSTGGRGHLRARGFAPELAAAGCVGRSRGAGGDLTSRAHLAGEAWKVCAQTIVVPRG